MCVGVCIHVLYYMWRRFGYKIHIHVAKTHGLTLELEYSLEGVEGVTVRLVRLQRMRDRFKLERAERQPDAPRYWDLRVRAIIIIYEILGQVQLG